MPSRERLVAAGTALAGLVALALAAATLTRTTDSGVPGRGGGVLGGRGGPLFGRPAAPDPQPAPLLSVPSWLLTAAVLLVLVAVVYALLFRRDLFTRALLAGLAAGVVVAVVVVLLTVFGGLLGGNSAQPVGNATGGVAGGGGGSPATDRPTAELPVVAVVLAGLALVAAAVAVVRSRTADAEPAHDEREPPGDDGGDPSAVGRAAGRAADRIEASGGADNEVYRAWAEMTDLVDAPDPETSTPGEFADAAVDAGLGREDVRALTRLFEEVRYGDAAPGTDERERRAVDTLRRIERRYGEEP